MFTHRTQWNLATGVRFGRKANPGPCKYMEDRIVSIPRFHDFPVTGAQEARAAAVVVEKGSTMSFFGAYSVHTYTHHRCPQHSRLCTHLKTGVYDGHSGSAVVETLHETLHQRVHLELERGGGLSR